MDIQKFLELAETLEKKKKGKEEELERLQRLFERFHLLNRKYLDKEAFEKARGSIPSIAEAIIGTASFISPMLSSMFVWSGLTVISPGIIATSSKP